MLEMMRILLFYSTALVLKLCVSADWLSWVGGVRSLDPDYTNSIGPVQQDALRGWKEHAVGNHGHSSIAVPGYPQSPLPHQPYQASRYRSLDGSGNNLEHPGWGQAGAAYTRIAHPRYGDGLSSMPVSVSGHPLPNPRVLSTTLFPYRDVNSRVVSHIGMQFGQFVAHEMASLVISTEGGKPIQCCSGKDLPSEFESDKCIPILVPPHDRFYGQQGVRCLSFVRSVTVPREEGHWADQMNSVSSFLDASLVYGSNPATARAIRTLSGGLLRADVRHPGERELLPAPSDKSQLCPGSKDSDPCYLAGDKRSNQTPPLTILHTLFLREHNRLARALGSMNPFWSDEKIYQEARRIVVAELQHITYQEWLPMIFGEDYYRYFGISPSSLFSRDYNPHVNAGVINSFSTAAFRFLHSMIPNAILACPASRDVIYRFRLSDTYLIPKILEATPDSFDDVVRGILLNPAAESDLFHSPETTNLLFKGNRTWGVDLVSFDIQRSRDHGLASYNDLREVCGLRRAKTFQDLAEDISQDRINALVNLYESVDDIDLLVGGAMERDLEGSILGPTFQCIVAEQFYRSRVGDRFFYDHADMEHSFSPDQLQQIKKCSMARLICDNSNVQYIQKKAFELESPVNPKVQCDDYENLPFVNLAAWKKPTFDVNGYK